MKADRAFLLGSVRNPPGDAVLDGGDEDLAPCDEGDLFAVRRQCEVGNLAFDIGVDGLVVAAVGSDEDFELAALGGAGWPYVDLAVPGIADVAGRRSAQEADRVGVVIGYLDGFGVSLELQPPDVEIAAALRQVVDGVFAGRPYRLAIVGTEIGQPGVLAGLRIEDPDITCEGRVVVLAQIGLESLFVGVEEASASRVPYCVDRRRGQHLRRHAA